MTGTIPLASEILPGSSGDHPPIGLPPAPLFSDEVAAVYRDAIEKMAWIVVRARDEASFAIAADWCDAQERRIAWALVYGEPAGSA